MRLRELVEDSDLGLTLLCGHDALDRTFTSVFTTDLRDPARYLSRDSLVLTGLMWWRGPADSEIFVRTAAEAGVLAVAAGEAALGTVPVDLVEACRRYGPALIRVPVEVSFGQITDAVTRRHEADRDRLLALALGRQRQLLSAVAEGKSLGDLLALVGSETGLTCRVMTGTGRQVEAAEPLPAAEADVLTRAFLVADRLPTTVQLSAGAAVSVLAVEPGLDERAGSWFLVCDGRHDGWPAETAATVHELASVVAVERQRWDERRRHERRIADEVIALAAAGRSAHAELSVHLADLGADPAGPFLVAVAACPGGPSDLPHITLRDAALHVTEHPVTGSHAGYAVAIIPCGPGDVATLRAALERLAPGLRRTRLVAGIASPVMPESLSGALEEALYAARLAGTRSAAVSVVASDEVTSHLALLSAVPDDVRRTFAIRVLHDVLAHDEHRGSDLLATLAAFLQADGSWTRCAEELHVHVNTVRYRIERVEELTGRDLSRLEDRVDMLLALRSLPAVRSRSAGQA